LAANGYITNETADRLSNQLPEDASEKAVQTLRPRIEAYIRNQLRGTLAAEGVNFESFKDQTLPLVGALTDELMEAGLAKMLELKAYNSDDKNLILLPHMKGSGMGVRKRVFNAKR
jgi:TPP-dependent indolepyruvate ferredoxin oxidoreductase alpha subunit